MKKTTTFKEFGNDFMNYYKCKEVNVKDEIEEEIVFLDLYCCDLFEFDYENKTIDIYL